MTTLTPKQAAQVKQAPPTQRPALRRLFASQKQVVNRNAMVRSIPRQIVSKPQRYSRGTPSVSHTFAERGHGYYDAFLHQPEAIVLGSQVGPCTPIEGYTLFNLRGEGGVSDLEYNAVTGNAFSAAPTGVTDNTSLLVFNPGSSNKRVCQIYRLSADSANPAVAIVTREDVDVAAFSALGPSNFHNEWAISAVDGAAGTIEDPTGRIENIPLRGSLRIRNVTENLAVGGEVRILRYNGGLLLGHDAPGNTSQNPTMGVKEYLDICTMMRDTKRTHSMDGHELKATHQSNTYPADHVRSMTFETDISFEETVRNPSYCTLLVLVDNFKASGSQVNNTYSIGMTVQRAARFKPGTILHNKAFSPPAHQPSHADATRKEAEKPATSSLLHHAKAAANSRIGQTLMEHAMNKITERGVGRIYKPIRLSDMEARDWNGEK